jgi:hypothetical protein
MIYFDALEVSFYDVQYITLISPKKNIGMSPIYSIHFFYTILIFFHNKFN